VKSFSYFWIFWILLLHDWYHFNTYNFTCRILWNLENFKASHKKFHKKRFFSSGNLAIENLIGIPKNPRNPAKSWKIQKIHRNQVVSTPWIYLSQRVEIYRNLRKFCEWCWMDFFTWVEILDFFFHGKFALHLRCSYMLLKLIQVKGWNLQKFEKILWVKLDGSIFFFENPT
jgi:hypothetical protein